jgi:hypothetical protein
MRRAKFLSFPRTRKSDLAQAQPIADFRVSVLWRRMRHAILLIVALLLGSCSEAVMLIIENRSDAEITIVTRDGAGEYTYAVASRVKQKIDWPDPDHKVTVIAEDCSRTFDLDEFYTPWNEWREADGELSRHYAVVRGGELQIVRPDEEHIATKGLKNPPNWRVKSLKTLHKQCSERRH